MGLRTLGETDTPTRGVLASPLAHRIRGQAPPAADSG
jgi:hypothetical protein